MYHNPHFWDGFVHYWLTRVVMKRLVWIILGMFFAHSVGAQITFEKLIGGDAFTAGECVIETRDQEYVATGQVPDQGVSGFANLYLVKTDTLGDTLWTRSYGEARNDFGYSVIETRDGGYAICGTTERFDGNQWQVDVYLVRTDANGDSLWTRSYGGSGADLAFAVQETFDDGFIIVGVTESFGNPAGEAYLIRTDVIGDPLWVQHYSEGYSNRAYSVRETPNGGFILCGRSLSSGSGTDADLYMLRTNILGDSLWAKTFGGTGFEEGNSVILTADGGYLAAGFTQSAANKNIYIVKTDTSGAAGWTRSIGGAYPEEAFDVANAIGGGYILAGTRLQPPSLYTDVYLLKVDTQGDTVWTKTYGGSRVDAAKSIKATADGGMIVAGLSNSYGVSRLKLYLLKTDANGMVSRPPPILSSPILLYPNPLTDHSVLEVPAEVLRAKSSFELFDLMGNRVQPVKPIWQQFTSIAPGDLPKGVYLYRISSDRVVYAVGRIQID